MPSVGVVGAGISGLALVRALAARNVDAVAFEAHEKPGGIVRTREVDGRVVELGPQRLRLTPPIAALLDDLGLHDELREGSEEPLYVYHDGSLSIAPLSVREAITTDLLDVPAKLRMLIEPLTGPAKPGETVDAFLTRKFGRQAARRYLGPLYSGLYGTDPREMPVEYSLGRALDRAGVEGSLVLWLLGRLLRRRSTPPICTLERGLGRLPAALYASHDERIHLDTPVRRVERAGDGYALVTDDGRTEVDAVVLTTPAPITAALLADVDTTLAATLRDLTYNPIGVAALDSDFDGRGMGVLVPDDEDVSISGATWNASFLGRDRLFTCYLDRGSYPELPSADDEELGAVTAEAFERITGASATPIHVHRWEPGMPAYDRSWTALDRLDLPPGIHLCANFLDRPGIPGRLRHAERIAEELAAHDSDGGGAP